MLPLCHSPCSVLVPERRSKEASSWHPVRARRRQGTPAPAVGGDEERTRIVLEHSAGEVAACPRGERGGADRGPGTERRAQERLQPRREPQVSPERTSDVALVALGHVVRGAAGGDRVRCERARFERLRDALAG